MTKSSSKYIIPVMTSALAAVMYWFWAFPYRTALSFREEVQLFLTTSSYFHERVSGPLDLLTYDSEFLTQFFNNYWIGAAVMTVMFIAVLLLCYGIIRKLFAKCPKILTFLIAALPMLSLWLYMGDPNVNLSVLIAVIVVLTVAYVIVWIGTRNRPSTEEIDSKQNRKATLACSGVLMLIEIAAIFVLYPKAYDKATYNLIDYDYMVRINDWDGILRYSDQHNPEIPMTVAATNLALGMTGQLDSRIFDYYQNGPAGLVPPFTKETLSSWTAGEILFHLGLINSAQRFYFEGMEAIPNYNKSVRAMKRLSETAMIRGDYQVAEKYLKILENTLFYKKWAQRNLELIKDPAGIADHPLYGALRRNMIEETYMFSESELDKTFGHLFLKNPDNNLAKQYLVVYPLLQRDLNKFAQYMGVVAEKFPQYNPLLAQQAVAFMSMKNGQQIPRGIVAPAVQQSLQSFAQAWASKNPDLIAPHRHTLFHYLLASNP